MVASCATLTALVATAGGAKLKERAHREIIEDLWLMSWGLENLLMFQAAGISEFSLTSTTARSHHEIL
jgi:hypothetical protein